MTSTSPLISLLISSTALATLLAVYFIIFFIAHKNKQRQNLLEQQRLKHEYESQLLNSRLEIQEETLNRVSMEIHDNVCQNLGAIKHQLSSISLAPAVDTSLLSNTTALLSENISQLRSISHTLNHNHISQVGLLHAIEKEINFQKSIHPVSFTLDVQGENDYLPDETELILFRILQEAVSNSIRHGQASAIDISMHYSDAGFEMRVKDNGKGFDTTLADKPAGIGLLNMKQRVQLINGNIEIHSASGTGTIIRISITHNKEKA